MGQAVLRSSLTLSEANEIAIALQGLSVTTSVNESTFQHRVSIAESLLKWLSSLVALSDGICRLVSGKVCCSILVAVLLKSLSNVFVIADEFCGQLSRASKPWPKQISNASISHMCRFSFT